MAPEGYKLLSVDFSNLEVHIAARIIGDRVLLKDLDAGLNYHDVNNRTLFGVEPGDQLWTPRRKVSKMTGFARFLYGGSDEGIYSKILIAVPDFDMSLAQFKQAIQKYMDAHPDYVKWVTESQEAAKSGRVAVNASGRKRTLYSAKASTLRQILNTPIQGTAADEVADDIVLLYRVLKPYQSKMVLPVHDEILFFIKDEEEKIVTKLIHNVMNRERHINGFNFRIPTDAEIGTHWGSLQKYNLLTGEIEGGSKH